jgi:hypothetical protein
MPHYQSFHDKQLIPPSISRFITKLRYYGKKKEQCPVFIRCEYRKYF